MPRPCLVLFLCTAACATPGDPAIPPLWRLEPAPEAAATTAEPALPSSASSAAPAPRQSSTTGRAGERRAFLGLGFTSSPDTLLLGGQIDFYTSDRLAVGPMLQIGIDDSTTLIAPSVHVKYLFPTGPGAGGVELLPFVQGGLGFAYLEQERRFGDDDDLGLLLQAGGGLEVALTQHTSLASTILVDLLPGEVLDERIYWSWQVLAVGFRF